MPPHPQHPESKVKPKLCDHLGRPIEPPDPKKPLSATILRRYYMQGMARVGLYDDQGVSGDPVREAQTRAQVPYVVTLLIYHSKFDITPTHREYFVYCPPEVQKAAELAMRLWQRWERPPRPEFLFGDMRDEYPKVGEGIGAVPIGDEDFDAHWKDVRRRPHKCAGNPDDPFAFTCLDQDVRLYKVTDFQEGMAVKIT